VLAELCAGTARHVLAYTCVNRRFICVCVCVCVCVRARVVEGVPELRYAPQAVMARLSIKIIFFHSAYLNGNGL
jgi:hypothetical protein